MHLVGLDTWMKLDEVQSELPSRTSRAALGLFLFFVNPTRLNDLNLLF